jgi:hypothetical protein
MYKKIIKFLNIQLSLQKIKCKVNQNSNCINFNKLIKNKNTMVNLAGVLYAEKQLTTIAELKEYLFVVLNASS